MAKDKATELKTSEDYERAAGSALESGNVDRALVLATLAIAASIGEAAVFMAGEDAGDGEDAEEESGESDE
jgi:hypothetical protein